MKIIFKKHKFFWLEYQYLSPRAKNKLIILCLIIIKGNYFHRNLMNVSLNLCVYEYVNYKIL